MEKKLTEREKGQIEAYEKILGFVENIENIKEPMPNDMWKEALKVEIRMVKDKKFRKKMQVDLLKLKKIVSKSKNKE